MGLLTEILDRAKYFSNAPCMFTSIYMFTILEIKFCPSVFILRESSLGSYYWNLKQLDILK